MNATLQTQANFGKHDVFKMFVLLKPACLHVFSGTGDAVCQTCVFVTSPPSICNEFVLYSSNILTHPIREHVVALKIYLNIYFYVCMTFVPSPCVRKHLTQHITTV